MFIDNLDYLEMSYCNKLVLCCYLFGLESGVVVNGVRY